MNILSSKIQVSLGLHQGPIHTGAKVEYAGIKAYQVGPQQNLVKACSVVDVLESL